MISKVLILLLFGSIWVQELYCQTSEFETKTKSFRAAQEYGLDYSPKLIRVRNLKLEDVRAISPDDQFFVLQLSDPKSGLRRGERLNGAPFDPYQFLFCIDEALARTLLTENDSWIGKNVNIFFRVEDLGLTALTYVARVVRIELLSEEKKIIKSISF